MTIIRLSTLLTSVILAQAVAADQSLYIPGFDSQELSASVVGVGADGHTTYAIVQAPDATDGSFPFTATLVEGASDAFVTMEITDGEAGLTDTVGETCTFSDGIAVCTVVDAEFATTAVESETISSFLVEGGATAATDASVTGSASSSNPIASKTASASGTGSQSGSSASPSATGNTSGTSRRMILTFASVPAMAGVISLLLAL